MPIKTRSQFTARFTGRISSDRMLSVLDEAASALRRARALPIGYSRNELRQLARNLIRLHHDGVSVDAATTQRHHHQVAGGALLRRRS